jgi:CBS domain-containing protein
MMTISELIRDRELFSADVNDTVLSVARYMVERNVGAVPVMQDGQLAGVFSERDIMRRVLVAGLDAARTPVAEVMTPDPRSVTPDVTLEHCLTLMMRSGFRHLPVVGDDGIVGFVSVRDLLLSEVDEKDHEVQTMRAYISNA